MRFEAAIGQDRGHGRVEESYIVSRATRRVEVKCICEIEFDVTAASCRKTEP